MNISNKREESELSDGVIEAVTGERISGPAGMARPDFGDDEPSKINPSAKAYDPDSEESNDVKSLFSKRSVVDERGGGRFA